MAGNGRASACGGYEGLAMRTDSFFLHLADFLCERRGRITKEWLAAVHRDERIHTSETLSTRQLKNHFPNLFDQMMDALRLAGFVTTDPETNRASKAHGKHRWEQGYSLDEMLLEIGQLRRIVIKHLLEYDEHYPGFRGESRELAHQIVNAFFDEIASTSALELTQVQQKVSAS